jgi:putative N6-adenine-specific DNA methylase
MTAPDPIEIFLAAPPGLEPVLADEAREAGFAAPAVSPGGVTVQGGWSEVRRANLELRGASRVLARVAQFRAAHLAQLDKRARRVAWPELLRPGASVKVEASCRRSRIYHAGAAAQRVERAIRHALGDAADEGPALRVMARIDDDLCTISLDTSGEPLHRRGLKQAVGKAPMRETLAALFLRACDYRGAEPVADPMCGSGTFVLEAAEIAAGLRPGRARRFAWEELAVFRGAAVGAEPAAEPAATPLRFHGFDRDAGAVRMSEANAERAGLAGLARFGVQPVSDFEPPEGPPGLVMVNPPYGARIGNKAMLRALHAKLGEVLKARFRGWRVGLVTSEAELARATGLPFAPPGPPVPHGGLKIRLYRAGPLG